MIVDGYDLDNIDIEALVHDRKKFDSFVYTSVHDAVDQLHRRWHDESIKPIDIVPKELEKGFFAFLYVALISPNYQIRRYIQIADSLNLQPLIFEQVKDKFTSNNEWKHSLGKLRFFAGRNKKDESLIEFLKILDFNSANGKSIESLKTLWGEDLIGFHHSLFFSAFPHLTQKNIFDGSDWLREHGETPREYYKAFLSLLIKHGIQFENFMLDEKEVAFTKDFFLPAFIDVYKKYKKKPLIVALEPTDTEGDQFWVSYPIQDKQLIMDKLSGV